MMHEVNPQEYAESGKDAKFQFIGTTGASGMDRAEKTTARLDNLNIAIKMETAHTPAKAIKLATGWERGADGDWRYEYRMRRNLTGTEICSTAGIIRITDGISCCRTKK